MTQWGAIDDLERRIKAIENYLEQRKFDAEIERKELQQLKMLWERWNMVRVAGTQGFGKKRQKKRPRRFLPGSPLLMIKLMLY